MHTVEYTETNGYRLGRVKVGRGWQWLVVFSDLQLGSANFNDKLFLKTIEFAKDNDAICLGLGDWMENGTKTSVGKAWAEQKFTPSQQRKLLVDHLKPIADRFIGICPGNHDLRGDSESDLDAMEWIAESLGVQYFPTEMFFVISAADENGQGHNNSYSVYAVHSRVAGKNSSTIAAAVKRDWSFVHADVRLKGHDHHLDFTHENVIRVNKHNGAVVTERQYIGLCGSCLERAGSYATVKPHGPADVGQLAMRFNMDYGKRDVQPQFIWGE